MNFGGPQNAVQEWRKGPPKFGLLLFLSEKEIERTGLVRSVGSGRGLAVPVMMGPAWGP